MQANLGTIFFWATAGGISGIAFASAGLKISYLLVAAIFLAFITLIIFKKRSILPASFFVVFLIGVVRFQNKIEQIYSISVPAHQIEKIALVSSEPQKKNGFNEVVIKIEKDKVLLRYPQFEKLNYGDIIKIKCILNLPLNKDENSFDYRMYLAKDGVYYTCEKPSFEKIGVGGNVIMRFLFSVKGNMNEVLNKSMPDPHAILSRSILFGGSNEFSRELKDKISKVGISHIVAVSGYNVAIIAECMIAFAIAIGFWRKDATYVAMISIFLFVALIGFSASAVRAALMGNLMLIALKTGRLARSYRAVVLAAFVMLMIDPLLLRYDMGFVLSFLATIGILISSSIWKPKEVFLDIYNVLYLTFAAQIFVIPLLMTAFHSISLISIIANMLILPVIPLVMLFSFMSALLAMLWLPLAYIFAWPAYLLINYILLIVHYLAAFSFASIEVKNVSYIFIFVYYAILILGIIFLKRWKTKKQFTEE